MGNNQRTINENELESWEIIYDEQSFVGDFFRRRMEKALSWVDAMNFSENAIIFDAGCGGGRLVEEAVKKGYHIIGMDSNEDVLKKALGSLKKRPGSNYCFLRGDVKIIPVKDSSLDAIICLGVISYLKSEMTVLLEFARVLKPGGLLILSATNKARLVGRLDIPLMISSIKKKIFVHKNMKEDDDSSREGNHRQRSYLIPRFSNSLESAGFSVSGYVTFPYELPTLFGREFLPRSFSEKVSLFIERFANLPLVGSFGSRWMIKAQKKNFS